MPSIGLCGERAFLLGTFLFLIWTFPLLISETAKDSLYKVAKDDDPVKELLHSDEVYLLVTYGLRVPLYVLAHEGDSQVVGEGHQHQCSYCGDGPNWYI
jgi:hypothetical protein